MTEAEWLDLAADVAETIAEVGQGAVLRKAGTPAAGYNPTPATPTFHAITVVDLEHQVRDRAGTLVNETQRTLYIAATGTVPEKGDRVALGLSATGMTDAAFVGYHVLEEVRRLAPAGTVVMFEADVRR